MDDFFLVIKTDSDASSSSGSSNLIFTLEAWILIAGTIAYVSLCVSVLESMMLDDLDRSKLKMNRLMQGQILDHSSDEGKGCKYYLPGHICTWFENMYTGWTSVCSLSPEYGATNSESRFLECAFSFFVVVFASIFTAHILSSTLLVQSEVKVVDLESATAKGYKICVVESMKYIIDERYLGSLLDVSHISEAFSGMQSGVCDALITFKDAWFHQMADTVCNKQMVGLSLNSLSNALPINPKIALPMNKGILKFQAMGWFDEAELQAKSTLLSNNVCPTRVNSNISFESGKFSTMRVVGLTSILISSAGVCLKLIFYLMYKREQHKTNLVKSSEVDHSSSFSESDDPSSSSKDFANVHINGDAATERSKQAEGKSTSTELDRVFADLDRLNANARLIQAKAAQRRRAKMKAAGKLLRMNLTHSSVLVQEKNQEDKFTDAYIPC